MPIDPTHNPVAWGLDSTGNLRVVAGVKQRAPARKQVVVAAIEPERDGWLLAGDTTPSEYLCPICGAGDVADVTGATDIEPMGLCANGHVAPLRHSAEV
jgi:hypothetical protein